MILAKIFHESPLFGRFFYNKLNNLQIKLLWVFFNIDIVLESIKNKKFLRLSAPLNDLSSIKGFFGSFGTLANPGPFFYIEGLKMVVRNNISKFHRKFSIFSLYNDIS